MKSLKCLPIIVVFLFSQIINAQWTNPDLTLTGRQIQCFTNSNSALLSGTNGGLVRSTNNGTSWTNIGGGLPYSNIRALLAVESYPFNLLTGMVSGRISMSTDYGDNWTAFPAESEQLPFLADINSILKRGNNSNFLVGTERGVYLLPQYYPLSTWIPINTGLPSGETKVRSLIEKNGEVFAGTNSGVYQLNGSSWDEKNFGLSNTNVMALSVIDTLLIAGTSQGSVGGVYISSDYGNNWTLSLNEPWVTSILTIGSNIFVGSFGNGVWRSTNYGNSWIQINDGLASGAYYVLSLGYDSQYLFDGTNGSSIWRRPLSQVVTGLDAATNLQPKDFTLRQNYPNPFNPSTTIKFQIPNASFVNLKVYDILGNEVATLVNEEKPVGNYEVNFSAIGGSASSGNAYSLSSGIYFYKLQSGSFVETKKMILLK